MKQKIDFHNKLILGPMAGITDLPFRLICKEQGCDILYTEMISAKGLMYKNKNSEPLLAFSKNEKPLGVQLFGSEPRILAEEARKLEDRGYDFVDVNMGCPVPKIVNNGEGSALMKNPDLIGEIVSAMDQACKLPITIKIRAGFDADHKNAAEVAKVAEQAGAAAIAVHARTREQFYMGQADWSVIKEVKDAVSIPVVGNGDITSAEDVLRMKQETGCDAFMIGRAAKGNPWIFAEMKAALSQDSGWKKPEMPEICAMIRRHAEDMLELKGEYIGIREMRKHVAWYTTGMPHSAKLRGQINSVETLEDLNRLLAVLEHSDLTKRG